MSAIEAFLAAEGRWWLMPYRFATKDEARAFAERLSAANPGREFRVI